MQNQVKVIDNKTWLKQYWARESTYSTYPKDCNLPICTLTQYGLFYDSIRKSFRCSECTFEYANIFTDSLDDLLSKHYKHSPTCSYSILSLELSLNFNLNKLDIIEPIKSNFNYKLESIHEPDSNKKIKLTYQSEESRLKTFENIRLLIDTKQLVSNGFYRVIKNSNSSFLNKTDTVDNIQIDQQQSHLAKIANALDSKLIHIRCVYCNYECILFKNYHLNTFLKSPFDEHKEKSAKSCPIFNESSYSIDLANTNEIITDFKSTITKYQERLKWLQCLYDFEKNESNSDNNVNAIQMLSNSENFKQLNDVEVKQLPKILEHLNLLYQNNLDANETSNNTSSNTAIVYVPGVSSNSGSTTATSDFNKLQNVLGLSDSVISERAYHPAYTSYQARLETYKEWPATLSQQPNDLAKAGFYYFGIKDMVKCFFCNGGLKNWDHNDDPYQDHVRWFPKCQFIRQLMGAEYVEQVREKYKNMDSGFTNEYINSANSNNNNKLNGSILSRSGSSLSTNDKRNTRRPVSPRTLNSRLDMHIVRKIVDTNLITRDSLKQAIEMKLSVPQQVSEVTNQPSLPVTGTIYGDDFKTPIEMARLAYDLDKMKQDKQDLYKSLSDFIISNLPNQMTIDCLRQFFTIKYCLNPTNIRLIKEQGSKNKCFALVCLNRDDFGIIDDIVNDLNGKKFPVKLPEFDSTLKELVVMNTNWQELLDKIKSTSLLLSNEKSTNNINHSTPATVPRLTSNSTASINSQHDEPKQNIVKDKIDQEKMDTTPVIKPKDEDTIEAAQLKEENERLKNERLCVVCLDKVKNIIFLPCAHLAACLECSFSLQNCPMCRTKIQATVRTFT